MIQKSCFRELPAFIIPMMAGFLYPLYAIICTVHCKFGHMQMTPQVFSHQRESISSPTLPHLIPPFFFSAWDFFSVAIKIIIIVIMNRMMLLEY